MGRRKTLLRQRRNLERSAKWADTLNYLNLVPLDEHRRFYARSSKFLLEPDDWNSTLRDPSNDDHANTRSLLIEFNKRNKLAMQSHDRLVAIERSFANHYRFPLTSKHRILKKRLWRLTREFMLFVRRKFPASTGEQDRVIGIKAFARIYRSNFFSNR